MEHVNLDLFLRQSAPFRFVDEVFYCDTRKIVSGKRRFCETEEYFKGHFPDEPVVPGVLVLESMAQTCRAWLNSCVNARANGYIAAIDRVKFVSRVGPGSDLIIEAVPQDIDAAGAITSPRFCRFRCTAKCGDKVVAKASLTLYQGTSKNGEIENDR